VVSELVEPLKIVTNTYWPSFRNVALTIQNSLRPYCESTICDFETVKSGGKMLCIGTANKTTIKSIRRLILHNEIVFYATTEGRAEITRTELQEVNRATIIAVSKFVQDKLQEVGVHVQGVIHHAINMNERNVDGDFYRKIKTMTDRRKVVLTVSANHHRKALHKLLRAQGTLEQKPGTFLIVHSQKDGYYDLQERVKALGINEIWLTNEFGTMNEARLRALYKLCTIYVQPSNSEGFGLPILEAFRFNKPVIAVNAPPFNEIIENNSTGILFPSSGTDWHKPTETDLNVEMHEYDARALSNAIRSLLGNHQLLDRIEQQIDEKKWNWNAPNMYPRLLEYLN